MFISVNTKIKAMRAKLLTPADYKELCAKGGSFNFGKRSPEQDLAKISKYLDKPIRGFLSNVYLPALNGHETNDKVLFMLSRLDSPQCGKSVHESLKRVLGAETDLRNILFVYRLKKYHQIHGDAVFSHLHPAGRRLNASEISRLAHAKDLEDFAQIAASGYYGKIFANLGDFARGEQKLTAAVRSYYKKEYRHESLAVVCGYLYARHLEAKNLRAISEGKKHGLPPEEIFELLHI
jgi:vacuolar-type H+-ATPase subunit C/Vma6